MSDETYSLQDLQGTALAADMIICQIENGSLQTMIPRIVQATDGGIDLTEHVLPPLVGMLSVVLKHNHPDDYHVFLEHVVQTVADEVAGS